MNAKSKDAEIALHNRVICKWLQQHSEKVEYIVAIYNAYPAGRWSMVDFGNSLYLMAANNVVCSGNPTFAYLTDIGKIYATKYGIVDHFYDSDKLV
jgi:hypothetical protein